MDKSDEEETLSEPTNEEIESGNENPGFEPEKIFDHSTVENEDDLRQPMHSNEILTKDEKLDEDDFKSPASSVEDWNISKDKNENEEIHNSEDVHQLTEPIDEQTKEITDEDEKLEHLSPIESKVEENVLPTTVSITNRNNSKDSIHSSTQDFPNGSNKKLSLKDSELGEAAQGGEDRDVWDNPIEFLLSCISMSVGLGNVWRFPFAAYKNGGGAFLIPYLVVLLFIGRPIYYLEMCLGQFSSNSQVKIWAMAPLFKGVGYGSMIGVVVVVSYYCSIMAQTVFYFFASFAKELPWSTCNKEWGGEFCFENGTVNTNLTEKSSAALYYELEAFQRYPNIDNGLGSPEWRLTLCLLFSWIVIFLSLVKGIQSSGKVAYFTAIFPYIVLLILLVRGVTLPGAWTGIVYFIKPQWEKIYDPEVWYAAVGQCFFSLGTGFGPIVMFASYNPFRHNVNKDALIISLMDTFTSLLAGVTIFAVLGYLSEQSGVPIEKVTEGGSGLAFVSYPEAIAKFDWVPQLFAVLFFVMLFTLGIGSATSLTGGIITIICDQFPKWVRWQVTLAICVIGVLVSLMYVTPGGPMMVDLMDHFGANFVIYVMAMFEVGAIAWVYGLNNFCKDIEFMLKIKVHFYWKFCWGFFIPVGLFAILVYTMATEKEFTSGDVTYPKIAIICGWLLATFAVLILPAMGLHGIISRKAPTFKEKFFESLKPSKHWGPKSPKLRAEWEEYKRNN